MKKTNNLNEQNNFKWVKHIIKIQEEDSVNQYIVIGKQHLETGLFLVSPYTNFISSLNKKATTQMAYANVLVPFLNFLYDKNPTFEIDDITGQDGIDFLTSLNVNPKTKKCYANYLEKFYIFLHKHDINCVDISTDLLFSSNCSIFNGKYENNVPYSNKDVLHNLRAEYIPLFLNTSIEVVPEIAFGIYLGCFGGLRNSEIVSIEYENISFKYDADGTSNMIINLVDKDLRPDVDYAFLSKVKKNRKQEIIPIQGDLLKVLYDKHKQNFKNEKTNAVFIDEKGLPMTAQTYANKFIKLKKEFIRKLENSSSIDARAYAITLKTYKWKTHICRGIFSNQIANSSNNIGEIALWRGDSSYTSALTYLNNKEEIGKSVIKTLDELYMGGWHHE